MKSHICLPILASLALASMASATTVGLPGGELVTTWDTFPGVAFDSDLPDTSDAPLTATLDSYTSGYLTGGGDRIYSGGNSFSMEISGEATETISSVTLIMKYTAPSAYTAESYFSIASDGLTLASATPEYLGSVTEGSNTFEIYAWTFSGLDSGESYSISISSEADHVSLDAIQLMVPEPSSAMLGILGAGLLMIRRRK
ncbi:PEP-CTERM sorting domain-containing protein [Luteolibacter pohnpeiensis]|uniref:PEP-CTERM sorting domain-containing protein n=1 Tax=Luteolibacter pohnpeiensis TaxID=454153 RepID=A0A934S7E0_9BACT|nr:PEP-CTERM sorting domain-containing protein [Luteolibacter pohnpeiensis]MBK1882584.1 PEP-CTERM sorting domain-containing protein [Luteolibacter pohnpeiensis]